METIENEKDKELWKLAKKRAGFKRHLATYIVINGMFWFIWYFTKAGVNDESDFPWPVWPMLGWGIGIVFDYMGAYMYTKSDSIQREYDKLKNK